MLEHGDSRRSRRWLKRIGLGKRSRLEPAEPPNRYERKRPGELDPRRHQEARGRIDKRCGHRMTRQAVGQSDEGRTKWREPIRRVGWEYVHVCVDDATRLAYVEVHADEKGTTVAALPASRRRVLRKLRRHRRARHDRQRRRLSLARPRDRLSCARPAASPHAAPTAPRTNGKAERFIRTMLSGWAYGAIYGSSAERTRALTGWLDHYNHRRPHGSLDHQPPLTRLAQLRNNAPGSYN